MGREGTAAVWARALERTESMVRLTHGCHPPADARSSLAPPVRDISPRQPLRLVLPAALALVRRVRLAA